MSVGRNYNSREGDLRGETEKASGLGPHPWAQARPDACDRATDGTAATAGLAIATILVPIRRIGWVNRWPKADGSAIPRTASNRRT
jgi:hypothetical protein